MFSHKVILLIFLTFLYVGCDQTTSKGEQVKTKTNADHSESNKELNKIKNPMANPAMIYGSDIGNVFNAYYKTGQMEKMISFIDTGTKNKFERAELLQYLSKLDFGYDMKLTGMNKSDSCFILSYVCAIDATKVVKRLKVKIEQDTARIVPSDLSKGMIFLDR